MKKNLVAALLTSAIMITLITASMVYFTGVSNKKKQSEAVGLDLLEERFGKATINTGASKELTIGKEVVSYPKESVKEIYNPKYSDGVKRKLDALKKKKDYTFQNPLLAYNPFGTNDLSMYVYFRTDEATSVKYTVQVKKDNVPDYTRTFCMHVDGGVSTVHEYELTGLFPGCQNYITLRLYNRKGKLIEKSLFDIYVDKTSGSVQTELTVSDGKSKVNPSYGLFCVCGESKDGKKLDKNVFLYDNCGILRGMIPMEQGACARIERYRENIIYNISKNSFVVVSPIGQVLKRYDLKQYQLHKDFIYNDYEQLWILADDLKKGSKTSGDVILSLDLSNGSVKKIVNMKELLSSYKKKVKKIGNWIDLNSIQRIGSSDVLVSSEKLSTIFKICSVTSEKPSIDYLIAKPSRWKKTPYRKLILSRGYYGNGEWSDAVPEGKFNVTGGFDEPVGQNFLSYYESPQLGTGQYYITMFNNNKESKENQSFYYKYMVDEEEGYYGLKDTLKLPYTKENGSVWNQEDSIIVGISEKNLFEEYDRDGERIKSYRLAKGGSFQRVYKLDMNDFWYRDGYKQEAYN